MTHDDVKRKVRNRLAALEYTPGFAERIRTPDHSEKKSIQAGAYIDEAWQNHNIAFSCASQDGYLPIQGNKLAVFIKKAMRKLLKIFWGWYIFPIYSRQSTFNGKTDNAVSLLITAAHEQGEALAQLSDENSMLKRQLEDMTNMLKTQQAEYSAAMAQIKAMLDETGKEMQLLKTQQSKYEKDQAQTKSHVDKNRDDIRLLGSTLSTLEQKENTLDATLEEINSREIPRIKDALCLSYDPSLVDDDIIDYFDFEDHFRGSRESIIESQQQYIPYLKTDYTDGFVVELGFGRGELLEMMRNNNIPAKGADISETFVKYCADMGMDVCRSDALQYLNQCEDDSLNGIILSQVAEHVRPEYLYQLIRTGFKKLRKNCCFIIETPNPESLSTYMNFYIDGSHIKPVHYLTLEYFFHKNGYSEITRLSDDYSRHPYAGRFRRYVVDTCDEPEKKEILNDINEALFSGRDYTIIARK